MEAAKRRGLLHDDTEYERYLWNSFNGHMAEDFMQYADAEVAEAMTFYSIEEKLEEQGRRCSDFGIPSPTSAPYIFE
ncbi:unnamed protein product [Rotaria sp. Silwood2]|nr:unnamed protein product [Rotaria sp. Silwood2]